MHGYRAARELEFEPGSVCALVEAMRSWMEEEGVSKAWVLADHSGAEAFYAACGFVRDDEQPVQMTLAL